MHFKVKVKVTLYVPSQKLKITQFWSYLGQKGGPGVNFTKKFCRQKMRLDLNYNFRKRNHVYQGKSHAYRAKNWKITQFWRYLGQKGGRGVNLTKKFFHQKMRLDLNYHFMKKKSRVPGKKSRVPGQKPHFLTFMVQNGGRGWIWPKKFFRQKMRLDLNYDFMKKKSRVPGKKPRVPGQKPVFH